MAKGRTRGASQSSVSDTGAHRIDDEGEKIWEVFCALDELERLVLWSHVVEEKSIRAVARDLNLNWHKAARILDGALRRIRRALDS